jgi:hypothetical protein
MKNANFATFQNPVFSGSKNSQNEQFSELFGPLYLNEVKCYNTPV